MANLSITTAWNETAGFVQREARLLFPIAFLLIALPGGLIQLFLPSAATPVPAEQARALLGLAPLWLVAVVLGMIGTIALSYLSLRPGASVGEALQVGARRFIMLFLATLLIALAAVVLTVPLVMIFGGAAALSGGNPSAAVGSVVLLVIVLMVAAIALWARLMLMTPVAAAENVGPIGIIARSWELTRGQFWKLLGFLLLLLLVYIVLSMVVLAIAGIVILLLAGQPDPGSAAAFLIMLVGALVNMVVTVYFTVLLTRIYVQLSGTGRENVFA